MKKHLTILLCSIALGSAYYSVDAVGIEDKLRTEGTLATTFEKELTDLAQQKQSIQKRIVQLQQQQAAGVRSGQGATEINKKIANARRALSQLKRTHARLTLKQAYELESQ